MASPQVNNVPPDLIAAVCPEPALTAVQELDPICTGDDLVTVVPSPNCPLVASPQVNNNPSDLIAAVCALPIPTAVQELDPI